jgi:pyruvate/2-oxoglutarate/acetoin dehydrogenase E1 component
MDWLAEQSDTLFLGQAVEYPGTAMTNTLKDVDHSKILEMPVNEDMQMGMTLGRALNGTVPVSLYPRWNFLLLATNQIVNHLDKLADLSRQTPARKVIIRTGIGSENPLNPGPQHTGDFTEAFSLMCPNINIVRLDSAKMVLPEYEKALLRPDGVSTILVEWGDKYAE